MANPPIKRVEDYQMRCVEMVGINQGLNVQANYRVNEGTLPIRQGDVGSIVIKERLPDNEAKVVFKGQDIQVKFDGPVPTQDRVMVEVTNQNKNGQMVVKPIQTPPTSTTTSAITADKLLGRLGFDPTANTDLKEAAKQILSSGGTISKDSLVAIHDFLKNETGSLTDKLNTINIMQQKNIAFTKEQLHSVHEALHGKPLTESLSKWMGDPIKQADIPVPKANTSKDTGSVVDRILLQVKNKTEQPNIVENVRSLLDPTKDHKALTDINKALQIQQAGRERLLQALSNSEIKQAIQQEMDLENSSQLLQTKDLPKQVVSILHDSAKLEKIGTEKLQLAIQGVFTEENLTEDPLSSKIQEITKSIQKDPSLKDVLESIQKVLEENDTPAIDLNKLKTAYEKATQMNDQGREIAARKGLATAINELVEANPQLKRANTETTLTKAEQYVINEGVQTLQLNSKDILVTQITKDLSQLALDFKKARREMCLNLDTASKYIESSKPGNIVPVKQMLDATINKLDQAILKGNYMLYTDMATEKKMLTASSKLAEARNHLTNGNLAEANDIVKEVKTVLEQLVFKPSDSKVKHYISDQEQLSPKGLLEKVISPMNGNEQGAREIFEKIKALGFTHETDAARAILDKQEAPHNVKSMLLQMIGTGDEGQKPAIEQALATITGQQLLNKQDSAGMQNLFLQMPILLNKQVENVKVYVNSQKKGEKIDWENCSLYFVLETKKLGEVGISISAVNRNLSITFNNNQNELLKKVEPLAEITKDRLEGIGYNVGSIQFKPLLGNTESKNADIKRSTSTFTEKGYDFTI